MSTHGASRRERAPIAAVVLAAHLLLAWLLMTWVAPHLAPADPDASQAAIFARIVEQPRPEPLGTPAPVKVTLVPVTHPKLPTPELQLIEVETLDSPTPGPDPAPSSAQLVTRPGPANAGGLGYPATVGDQGLRLVRRVPPIYSIASIQHGEAGVVQMGVYVDEHGRVARVSLLRSSGYEKLDGAALEAVRKWKFEPLVHEGHAQSVWAQVNLRMGIYQHKFCRIRDDPGGGPSGEVVHDGPGSAGYLGNEAALQRLIDDLGSGNPDASGPLLALVRKWGQVQSIHFVNDAGYQGWVIREVLPAYIAKHPDTVQVRWDMYVVQQERRTTIWEVAMDSAGEIWCVHVGPASQAN